MTVVCLLDGCALHLYHRSGHASIVLSASPLRNLSYRLSLRRGTSRRFWFCRAGSYSNVSAFSTSTCRRSADLRCHASRLRSVLDSAWKAASGTRAQILSRLKAEETSRPPAAPHPTLLATATEIQEEKVTRVAPPTAQQAPPSAVVVTATEIQEQERKVIETAPPTKQTTPLFHAGSLTVHLSQHINSYFSSLTKPGPESCPETPRNEPSFSLRKGFGSHFSYIGSYITLLVPRFRTEPKSRPLEVEEAAINDAECKKTVWREDQRAAEERTRRLLLQREKIIARVSVDNRTRALVQALRRASDVRLYIRRVEDLSLHLLEFPETRSVSVQERAIPCLLRLRQAGDVCLQAAVRQALALLGFIEPVRKRGVRILSIDGGGTRGLLALQTLRRLQELSGKPIHQLFDYICGVSTGAIMGFMLGIFQIPLKECEDLYRKLSSDVFKQNVIVGTVKMSWSHAFYDSEIWENVLKEKMGSDLLIETTRDPDCPKVAAVSTVVNRGPPVKAFVFRNYSLPVGVRSHYRGSCTHRLWEAIRASSAAPGYFQEFALGNNLHQDGGMLINNPTALAIHECQCLWPDVPLQCVVSLGTGRFETTGRSSISYTNLKTKLTNVISSATDTEEVHTMLDALLPPNTYFRFNPYMSEDVALDESREEKLVLLQAEGLQYLERNQEKLKRAVSELTRDKSHVQRLSEWLRLRALMYEGFYKM
ncbi:hypothetical protein QQF64_023377 [Cirrhinus molitorella]|uniref:PNPLA domain-containing protein n=1 Tax=Cirrhinus molitorella TaxID=172907 RepID=A0ABR3L517_9TELE